MLQRTLALSFCFLFCFSSLLAREQKIALNELVVKIREPKTEPREFRRALSKIGEYLAIDLKQHLSTKEVKVTTLTNAVAHQLVSDDKPVLITILRAGLPLLFGVQKIFPDYEVGFIGSSRNEDTLKPRTDYIAIPNVKDKTVILTDTMVATGGSMLDAIKIMERHHPRRIYVICAIASKSGLEAIHLHNPDIKIFSATVDPVLNNKGYIVPGLGDAGDRAFGLKH